jgi:hypothetical protein
MPQARQQLHAVLAAAQAALAARAVGLLTTDEWDALEHAVAAATAPPPDEREETFSVYDDHLVRDVVPKRGRPYRHRCRKDVYDDVAYAVEQRGTRSFTNEEIRDELVAPFTQVMVALAFLKERGYIVPVYGRRHVAATDYVYEDALVEYHALREKE